MPSERNFDNYSLIIGRFQPLHNGHIQMIRQCAEESEYLTICIGSAQYSHEPDNPFTAGERYLMIEDALVDEGIDNYFIVPIEDINRYSVWVSHVESMVPPFKNVYSNNPFTRRLFSEAGYKIIDSPLYNREMYSGTTVRKNMRDGGDWKSLVPEAVARAIDEIDGVNRVRDISGGD